MFAPRHVTSFVVWVHYAAEQQNRLAVLPLFDEEFGHTLGPTAKMRRSGRNTPRRTVEWEFENGVRYFGEGWRHFFGDPGDLQNGDLAQIPYMGESNFVVAVYGLDGSEKPWPRY